MVLLGKDSGRRADFFPEVMHRWMEADFFGKKGCVFFGGPSEFSGEKCLTSDLMDLDANEMR